MISLFSDAETGEQLSGTTFIWRLTTSSGQVVLPSYLFEEVKTGADGSLQLSGLKSDIDIIKLAGGAENLPLRGECVAVTPDGEDGTQGQRQPSGGFVIVDAEGDAGKAKLNLDKEKLKEDPNSKFTFSLETGRR